MDVSPERHSEDMDVHENGVDPDDREARSSEHGGRDSGLYESKATREAHSDTVVRPPEPPIDTARDHEAEIQGDSNWYYCDCCVQ